MTEFVMVPREQLERNLMAIAVVGQIDGHDVIRRESVRDIVRMAAAPAVAAEPVAWMRPADDPFYDSAFRDHKTVAACTGNTWEGWIPLYTHPKAEPVNQQLLEALRVAVESDLGALWHWPDTARKTWMNNARAAIARAEAQPALPTQDVPMPTSADQAELMAKLGTMWLEQNAPERLKALPTQEEVMRLADEYSFSRARLEMCEAYGRRYARQECDEARAALLAALAALPREKQP